MIVCICIRTRMMVHSTHVSDYDERLMALNGLRSLILISLFTIRAFRTLGGNPKCHMLMYVCYIGWAA